MGRAPYLENPAYVPDSNEFLIVLIDFLYIFIYL